jgi:hypothetical protein
MRPPQGRHRARDAKKSSEVFVLGGLRQIGVVETDPSISDIGLAR